MLNDYRVAQQRTQLELIEISGMQVLAQLPLQVMQGAYFPAECSLLHLDRRKRGGL